MNKFNQSLIALMVVVSVSFTHAQMNNNQPNVKLLTGQWRVKTINFHHAPEDKDNKFTSYHMHQGIVRYDFKPDNEFTYVVPNKQKTNPKTADIGYVKKTKKTMLLRLISYLPPTLPLILD